MNEGDELREGFLRIGRELVLDLPRVSLLRAIGLADALP